MHLTIHIGPFKTGTTAIQQALDQGRGDLARAGVLVPASGLRRPNRPRAVIGHHDLAHSAADERFEIPFPGPWSTLLEELSGSTCERAVVSSEFFCTLTPEQVKSVRDILGDTECQVVVYTRDRSQYLLSTYKHNIRTGRVSASFDECLPTMVELADIEDIVRRWSDAFGLDAVLARPYEESRSDIVADFLRVLGVDDWREGSKIARPNRSLDDATTHLLRAVNIVERKLPVPATWMANLRRRVMRSRKIVPVAKALIPWIRRPIWQPRHDEFIREHLTDGVGRAPIRRSAKDETRIAGLAWELSPERDAT